MRLSQAIPQYNRQKGKAQAADAGSLTERIATLPKMTLEELRTEFETVIGKQSQSRNRNQLGTRIAEALQSQVYQEKMAGGVKPTLTVPLVKKGRKVKSGDHSKNATRSKKAKTADDATQTKPSPAVRDERLPKPGSVLERVYEGKTLHVTVTDDGFVYEDKPYRSLSAVAMAITGAKAINGYLWFRLGKYAKPAKAKAKEGAGK